MNRLWVDDEREAPDGWLWARSVREAQKLIQDRHWDVISLDHDLGGGSDTRVIVMMMCENPDMWPDEVLVHSMNPVGRRWLEKMVQRYKPEPSHVKSPETGTKDQ